MAQTTSPAVPTAPTGTVGDGQIGHMLPFWGAYFATQAWLARCAAEACSPTAPQAKPRRPDLQVATQSQLSKPRQGVGRKQMPLYFLPMVPDATWLMAKRVLRQVGASSFTLAVARAEFRRHSDLRARRKASGLQPPVIVPGDSFGLQLLVRAANDMPALLCDGRSPWHPMHKDPVVVNLAQKHAASLASGPA